MDILLNAFRTGSSSPFMSSRFSDTLPRQNPSSHINILHENPNQNSMSVLFSMRNILQTLSKSIENVQKVVQRHRESMEVCLQATVIVSNFASIIITTSESSASKNKETQVEKTVQITETTEFKREMHKDI